jgi:hypothetical protein
VEPSGKFLYVAGTQGTATLVSYYSIDAAGALNPTAEGTSSLGTFSSVGIVSRPNDHFLYIVGTGSSNGVSIFALALDSLTGTPSDGRVSPGLGQFAKSVALAPGGQFLFIGRGQSQGQVDTYALPGDGLSFGQPLSTLSIAGATGAPFALAADVSGTHLYAAIANLGLKGFAVNSSSGALSVLPGAAFVGAPLSPTAVMTADPVEQFPNLYYEQRVFGISASGALIESSAPLSVTGSVTGIAAASTVDPIPAPPTDPISPIPAPSMSLTPSSLQFAAQLVGGSSASRSVSLANTGSGPLILSGISLTGANASDFALSHDCQALVGPASGCTITITFQPQFQGVRQASLSVVDNAPDSPHTVALAGTAELPFTLQLDNSASTVTAGQMAQYSLRLVPAPGFVGKILLDCKGAPDQATCEFPASMDLNGGPPKTFSVTVRTKARSTLAPPVELPHPTPRDRNFAPAAVGIALALLFLWLSGRRPGVDSRPAAGMHGAAAALLIGISLLLVACAASTGPGTSSSAATPTSTSTVPTPSPAAGTPAGQYSLTVTATFGTVTESVPLALSVQ